MSNVAFGGAQLSELYAAGAQDDNIKDGDDVVYRLDLAHTRGLAILPQRD